MSPRGCHQKMVNKEELPMREVQGTRWKEPQRRALEAGQRRNFP